ncbi:winged helix-turn-helix domain-containing protein [Vibrio sonorensis]|uniref:winged helix-turn-helix domain-containing protein n=1 Tax=Vibrio sonorensis TaxID=1004316 RepID=UPI0008DAA6B5
MKITLDTNRHLLSSEAKSILLSATEIGVLNSILTNYPSSSHRDYIADANKANGRAITYNHVNVIVHSLRRKFKSIGIDNIIMTERGIGYRVNDKINVIERPQDHSFIQKIKRLI